MPVREAEVQFLGRQKLGTITHALPITISLVTVPGLAQEQQVSAPQQNALNFIDSRP